jgi:hypothetical protein
MYQQMHFCNGILHCVQVLLEVASGIRKLWVETALLEGYLLAGLWLV